MDCATIAQANGSARRARSGARRQRERVQACRVRWALAGQPRSACQSLSGWTPPGWWGKVKTATQLLSIFLLHAVCQQLLAPPPLRARVVQTTERVRLRAFARSRARRLACEACERVEESLRRGALRGGHGTKED